MAKKIAELVSEYRSSKPLYDTFTERIETYVKQLMEAAGLSVHTVTSRAKEVDKFKKKITRRMKKYEHLSEVTDLAGVRIICYFTDQVDSIAELIRANFDVIEELSVDKGKLLDPDRFGYLSLHYVVKLPQERAELFENQAYRDLLCEIQVRSILQHAWAEIEHDLGYKFDIEIPKGSRRRFSRLAGLLEMADEDFVRVREEIEEYSEKVKESIETSPQDVLIDKVSLSSFLSSSPIVHDLDAKIAEIAGSTISAGTFADSVEQETRLARYLNVDTIEELNAALTKNKERLLQFARRWSQLNPVETPSIDEGVSVRFLFTLLAGVDQSVESVRKYLEDNDIGFAVSRQELAESIVEVIKDIKQE